MDDYRIAEALASLERKKTELEREVRKLNSIIEIIKEGHKKGLLK
jgi:hypothetical protein